jgi:predicted nucleotidyltransferase
MPVARSLDIAGSNVAAFCRRWKVRELAVFGSALREDFSPDSDVDILVTFEPDANWGLLDQTTMESELAALLGRRVDLVSRRAIERSPNWIRRQAILESAETVHVAR